MVLHPSKPRRGLPWYALIVFTIGLVVSLAGPLPAAEPEAAVFPQQIPDAETAALFWFASNGENSRKDYENLSPEEKARLQRKYREWKSLPPEKRKLLRRRMHQLEQMPPEERALYQRVFKRLQSLPAKERRQVQRQLENWHKLSAAEKEALRRKFRNGKSP